MLGEGTSLFPLDVWLVLLDFLTLRDFLNLLVCNKRIRRVVDQETVYKRRAQNTFPPNTLDVSKYDNSDSDDSSPWKALVKTSNCENGIYIRHMANKYSKWRHSSPSRFYVGALQWLVWDRKEGQIWAIIEGFGHSDLRPADTSLISHVGSDRIEVPLHPLHHVNYKNNRTRHTNEADEDDSDDDTFGLHPLPGGRRWEIRLPRPRRPRQHAMCHLAFDEADFANKSTFIFTYSGMMTMALRRGIRSDDYESIIFLEVPDGELTSLPHIFNLKRDDCEFVTRDDYTNNWMKPSNVLDWNVAIPDPIRNLHARQQWGSLSQA